MGKLQATSAYILQPRTLVELKKAVEYESTGPLPLSKWRSVVMATTTVLLSRLGLKFLP